MSLSTISQTIREFYLKYNYTESSSLLVHSPFARHVQFALRMVIAFLLGGFLAYGTPLKNQLAQNYMIPTMSILCLQETFGLTLSNSIQITFVIVPLSIFLFAIQKIGLSYHQYVAGELLLLISTLYVSYKCAKVNILLNRREDSHFIKFTVHFEVAIPCHKLNGVMKTPS